MAELAATPALPRLLAQQSGAIVEPASPRGIASIALLGDAMLPLLNALDGALPLPGRQIQADLLYLWSGPASWLAIAPAEDGDFAARLAARLAGIAAVTDQSDGRTILRVRGPCCRQALAKLLPIDLHERAFPADATALTLAGHISIQIWRSGAESFDLACFRSFAESLYAALHEACREFETRRG